MYFAWENIIDFQCPECGQGFSVSGQDRNAIKVQCPRCNSFLEKTITKSIF